MPDYRTLGRQLLRGSAVERRSLERELQAVATELMFGAEPAALVERLIRLGAPPEEARRIIETAHNDPLIKSGREMALVLRRRDWLLGAMERQQTLWPGAGTIERRSGLGGEEFLERHYSRGRPVILAGEMKDWPALQKWTPQYLALTVGAFETVYRAENDPGRARDPGSAPGADRPQRMPFDGFIRMITEPDGTRGGYMLADDLSQNVAIAGWLKSDLGFLHSLLDLEAPGAGGTMWIGSSGILTPLHHDLVNCLVAQVAGRNRFKLIAAGDVARVYNHQHAFSEIRDLEAPEFDAARYPALANARIYDVTLEPGEILFVPLAWWYQVRSAGFAASVTYTNFRWPNDSYRTYPVR
jgi:hypothetical protein